MTTVVLLGTLDTKGAEYEFVRERLLELGCQVIVVDAGTMGQTRYPVDIGPDEVAAAAGFDRADLAAANDRGAAMAAMSEGAARVVERLHAEGRLDGILALGGSGGATLGSGGDAGAADRRPEAHRVDDGRRRHPAVRRRERHRDALPGRRHRRHQSDLDARSWATPRRPSRAWPRPAPGERETARERVAR